MKMLHLGLKKNCKWVSFLKKKKYLLVVLEKQAELSQHMEECEVTGNDVLDVAVT